MDSNVHDILDNFGERVTRLAKINIGATRTVNGKKRRTEYTGKLRESLSYEVITHPNSFSFSISMEEYGLNVDSGRPPKNKPSVASLETYIRKKPVRLRDKKTGSFKKRSDTQVTAFAEYLQERIHRFGTPATFFLTNPFNDEFKKLPDDLIEAFGLDAETFLNDKLNAISNGN